MADSKLLKIAGILRVQILSLNFETKTHEPEYIFCSGLCVELSRGLFISTCYIPGVTQAEFFTYYQLGSQVNQIEEIDWSDAYKLSVGAISKQWDYVNFSFVAFETINFDFISFSKINKTNLDTKFFIFGPNLTPKPFNIDQNVKLNLIHDMLPKQIFYLSKVNEEETNLPCTGSFVYSYDDEMKINIFGFISADYDDSHRIVPSKYLEYEDNFIEIETVPHCFDRNTLLTIPIVKETNYPKFTKGYGGQIKKDDVIISIDNYDIYDMQIFNPVSRTHFNLDEYLTTKKTCEVLIVRKKSLINIIINTEIFKLNLVNVVYLDINDLYVDGFDIKFSSDVFDAVMANDPEIVTNIKDVIKYSNNVMHKVDKIII